jgi:hypothetical protein
MRFCATASRMPDAASRASRCSRACTEGHEVGRSGAHLLDGVGALQPLAAWRLGVERGGDALLEQRRPFRAGLAQDVVKVGLVAATDPPGVDDQHHVAGGTRCPNRPVRLPPCGRSAHRHTTLTQSLRNA